MLPSLTSASQPRIFRVSLNFACGSRRGLDDADLRGDRVGGTHDRLVFRDHGTVAPLIASTPTWPGSAPALPTSTLSAADLPTYCAMKSVQLRLRESRAAGSARCA